MSVSERPLDNTAGGCNADTIEEIGCQGGERLESESTTITESNDKYYWVNRASEFHQRRMLSLKGLRQVDELPLYDPDSRYLMYRHRCIHVANSNRLYEFLIEYDAYNPSQGIYFGCKMVTKAGGNHSEEIHLALNDWVKIRPVLLLRLNNVFPEIDFTYRFRDTDNDADNTFWPFWIQLYEQEDICDLGVRCLDIISTVYAEYLNGNMPLPPKKRREIPRKLPVVRTAFTFVSLDYFYLMLEKNIKASSSMGCSTDLSQIARSEFLRLIDNGIARGYFTRANGYEVAWLLSAEFLDVDFHCLMKVLFDKIAKSLNLNKLAIPWNSLVALFLRSDGTAMKEQVKTLKPKSDTIQKWTSRFADL